MALAQGTVLSHRVQLGHCLPHLSGGDMHLYLMITTKHYNVHFYLFAYLLFRHLVIGVSEKYWGKDPSRVVIDEMVGTWIALLAVPADNYIGYMFAAFILFRFFDILKPLGIKQAEKLPSGYGIMADDILSGIYGGIVILLYRFVCA